MTVRKLEDLTDRDRVADELARAGLGRDACEGKAALFFRSANALIEQGVASRAEAIACYVPGRIEVLGKHTDYAGGRSLLAVPERGFCMVAVRRSDQLIRIGDVRAERAASFALSPALSPGHAPMIGEWSNYPMTAARRLARNFPGDLKGADIAFESDLPVAAGMSSSSALVVATFLALVAVNRLDENETYQRYLCSREDLAAYLGCVENGQSFGKLMGDQGVGTFGGSEDHVAALCAERGTVKQYSYCPVRHERTIPLPADCVFAVACSGVVAEKTGAAMEQYNRLSRLAQAVVHQWNTATGRSDPHLAAILESADDAVDQARQGLDSHVHPEFSPGELHHRFEHFLEESEQIVSSAADHLHCDNLSVFGRLVDRSQEAAASLLGNQVPETMYLAERARHLGAIAASAFGAGFGGSVWAMVSVGEVDDFLTRWADAYTVKFPTRSRHATFFATHAGRAAFHFTA